MYQQIIDDLRSIGDREAADAIEHLYTELEEEKYRHDRYRDFEVAEAEQLRQMTIERSLLARKLREVESDLDRLKENCTRWRDAKREPPEEIDEYIVMIDGELTSTTLLYARGLWFDEDDQGRQTYYNVTHWLPMPKAPWEE